jgi:riboflavin synthase
VFTGIIEEVGKVEKIQRDSQSSRLTVTAKVVLEDVHTGDSIAVNGICLTVTEYTHASFTADVMNETWNRTGLAKLTRGTPVNLERAMPVNGRFGGHIVTGHIDGTGRIREIKKDKNAVWYRMETSKDILSGIVLKGSITIDGISLTVAKVSEQDFSVSVIPHTLDYTGLKDKKLYDIVNLENDIIGKYVKHFITQDTKPEITKEFLMKNGF